MYADIGVKQRRHRAAPQLSPARTTRRRDGGGARAAARPRLEPHLHLAADDRQPNVDAVDERLGEGNVHADLLRRRLLPLVQARSTTTAISPRRCPAPRPVTSAMSALKSDDDGRRERRRRHGHVRSTATQLRHDRPHRQDAQGYGGSVQAVEKTRLFGMGNQFLIGASYDHGDVDYSANSELGFFGPKFVSMSFATPSSSRSPTTSSRVRSQRATITLASMFTNTTDLTIGLRAHLGRPLELRAHRASQPEIPTRQRKTSSPARTMYYRFNPMAGATYNLLPGLTVYGGYSEANRAPTAAELACADPEAPVPDRELPDGRSASEAGRVAYLRAWPAWQARLVRTREAEWTAGLFRTENTDDIIAVSSPINGRGFFFNAGDTLRQGVEAGVTYTDRGGSHTPTTPSSMRRSRRPTSFVARQSPAAAFECLDPSNPNPDFDEPLCIQVNPGDRSAGRAASPLQGRSRLLGDVSTGRSAPIWSAASDQVFFGDEGNDGIRRSTAMRRSTSAPPTTSPSTSRSTA